MAHRREPKISPKFAIGVSFRLLDHERKVTAVLLTHDEVLAVPRIGESYLISDEYDVRVIDVEHNMARNHLQL